jgi:hypothetical protein
MLGYVQVVQDGSRSANVFAAYPPETRKTHENPHGVLYRAQACTVNSTIVRDFVVAGVVGRDGIRTGAEHFAHPTAPTTRDSLSHEVDDREDRLARIAANTGTCVATADASIGVGISRRVHSTVAHTTVVVSSFAADATVLAQPGLNGTTLGSTRADPVSYRAADGLARLGTALFRSTYEAAFTALTTAVMAAAATEPEADLIGGSDVCRAPAPAFVAEWAVPLSPLFSPCSERIPRKLGAEGVVARIGRSAEPPAYKGITSAADLLTVLDMTLAASIAACLQKKPMSVALKRDAREGEVAMAANRADRDDMDALNDQILAKHAVCTALFSPWGLCRAHGKDFYAVLSHDERMIIASFAMALGHFNGGSPGRQDTAAPSHDAHIPPVYSPAAGSGETPAEHAPSYSEVHSGLHGLFKELPWSISTSRGDPSKDERTLCTLQGYVLGNGYAYVAVLRSPKNGALATAAAGLGCVTRILRQSSGNTEVLGRHMTQARVDTVGAKGGCCGGSRGANFYDLTEVDHTTPGLMAAHLHALHEAHFPQYAVAGQFFGSQPTDKLPKGIEREHVTPMLAGLHGLRVSVSACPPLATAASRTAGAEASGLVVRGRDGKPRVERAVLDTTDAQEWQVHPTPECAFVVSLHPTGGSGSRFASSSAETVRCAPATVSAPYRPPQDLSNGIDARTTTCTTTSDYGSVTGSFRYSAPTPVYVDEWPTEDGAHDSVAVLNERSVNRLSRGHQPSCQSSLAWGSVSVSSSMSCAGHLGTQQAVSGSRLWAKAIAVAPDSILRSAVNASYRSFAKSRREVGDDVESHSEATTPDLSDYDSDW